MFDCPQDLREEEMFEVPQWAANKVVYQVDPSFGTTEDLKELVQKAHERGMKVVLDAVYNRTGREFFAFQDILEKGEKSKYLDWYFIDELPPKGEWGEIPNFKCFGYYGGMPMVYYGEETIAMLFNCGSSVKEFHAYAQKYNLLTDSAFDGKVDGLDAAVIVV